MLYVIAGLAAALAVAVIVARAQAEKINTLEAHLEASQAELRDAIASVSQRDHVIDRMQEVYRAEAEQKQQIRTGSSRDRFDASLRVLRDGSRSGGSGPGDAAP